MKARHGLIATLPDRAQTGSDGSISFTVVVIGPLGASFYGFLE